MAGRPILAAMVAAIDQMGGEAAMVDRIANGETVASIARTLGCSRNLLSTYLNRDDTRRATMNLARETGADAMAEQALTIADAATPQTERVARLQIEQRKWLAGKVLPDTYGDKSPSAVTINVNTLHLDALRELRAERLAQVVDVGYTAVQTEEPLQLSPIESTDV